MLLSSKKVSKSSSFTPRWRQKGSRNGGRHCVIQDPLQYGRKFPRRKVKNGILKCPPKLRRCNRNKLLSVNVTWRSLSNLWRTVWVNPLLGPPLTGDRRPIILDACYRIKKVLETGVQYMLNTGFQIKMFEIHCKEFFWMQVFEVIFLETRVQYFVETSFQI